MGMIEPKSRHILMTFLGGLILATSGPASRADGPAASPFWVGTGSCAAAACHGGRREPLGLKGSEYGFSGAYDPHTRAFSVLYDDRSKVIERNYRQLHPRPEPRAIDDDRDDSQPFKDDLCLRCHVHQGYDSRDVRARSVEFTEADGVGCEGCHGPAGRWLVPHTEYGWKGLSDQQKEVVFGLRPTKDLLARGKMCAECHVGDGPTDVNHDLIAAGHPRLNFEYGSQLAKLPKHWRIGDDKVRVPDYEAKVWALGRLIAAKASLDLLESRALRATREEAPWPEFAEYSCFSCHHNLVEKSWRQVSLTPGARPGSLPWGTWYLPASKGLTLGSEGLEIEGPGSPIGPLREIMAGPAPDPRVVARRAHAASDAIARLAERVNRDRIPSSQVRANLANVFDDIADGPLDWDRAAQKYLAIIALDRSLGESNPGYTGLPVRAGLDRLRQHLDLPRQDEEGKGVFDSPNRYNPGLIQGDLQAIRSALPNP